MPGDQLLRAYVIHPHSVENTTAPTRDEHLAIEGT